MVDLSYRIFLFLIRCLVIAILAWQMLAILFIIYVNGE